MVDALPLPAREPATNDSPPRGRPLRVLHVLGSLNRGGVETWLMNVLRHLDPRRVRFDFVTHSDRPAAYDDEARALGARIYRCTGYRRPLRYARQLRGVIAEGGPYDAVHSHVHDYSGAVLWAAAGAGVPVRIAHSHNDTSGLRARAPLVRRAYQRLMHWSIRRYATRHLACSDIAGRALFGPAWPSDRRAVNLPYGIDLSRFAERPARAELAAALGLPPDAKVIGHVGRFDPQKNHRRLVGMAAAVLKDDPAARLVLVGDGPLRPEIERHAESLSVRGQVVFAGLRGDVPAVMGGVFDVFLFPSLYEGLGIVVVEAQAAGVPVVMSDAVPAEAVRIPDRVTTLPLSAPDGAWAARLRHLLARRDDPRPPFGQRVTALRDFDVHENVARLEKIYRSAEAP